MKKRYLIAIVSFLLSYSTVSAQWVPKDTSKNHWFSIDTLHDFCKLCLGEQHIIGQPYNHPIKKELRYLISSGAILATGLTMGYLDQTKPFSEDELAGLDKYKINNLDRGTIKNWSPSIQKASDFMLVGITFLPVLFLGEHHLKKDVKSLAILSLEVFAFNYGTTLIVKSTVNRTRPYVYNTSLPISTRTDKESRLSFYSGHTSQTAAATFLFAKVISDYHPTLKPSIKIGVWTFAVTVPALEAYFRVKGGKHYPSDVIVGYVLGAFSGWLLPELHRNFNYRRPNKGKFDTGFNLPSKPKINMGIVPTKSGMAMTMGIVF